MVYKKLLFFVLFATIFSACAQVIPRQSPTPRACTMEAKLCPDGSSVGRTGPNCEFAACPPQSTPTVQPNQSSGIQGKVILGPTCPVMRNPPDPKCADKPYQTQLVLTTQDPAQVIQEFSSDAQGEFSVAVPAGDYVLRPAKNAKILPRCSSTQIHVNQNSYTEVTINCDTGIR